MTHIDLENFKDISAKAKYLYCEDVNDAIDDTCSQVKGLV